MSEPQEHSMEETTLLPMEIKHQGVVYRDKYQTIRKIFAQFRGFSKEYFVTEYGEKAGMVVDKNGEILLTRQYRLLINGLSYEIPAGKVNEKESPREAALRECMEETGVKCTDPQLLIEYDPDLEYSKNHTYVFHAKYSAMIPDNVHQYVFKPLGECLKMIFEGRISDSISIISILAYSTRINNAHKK